jgi:hypothetical protein
MKYGHSRINARCATTLTFATRELHLLIGTNVVSLRDDDELAAAAAHPDVKLVRIPTPNGGMLDVPGAGAP